MSLIGTSRDFKEEDNRFVCNVKRTITISHVMYILYICNLSIEDLRLIFIISYLDLNRDKFSY